MFKILGWKSFRNIRIAYRRSIREFSKYHSAIEPMPTKYGGKTNITVLPGVGIGPEIMESTLQILEAAEAPLSYEIMTIRHENDEDFSQVLTSIRRNKVALKANIETKSRDPLAMSRNVSLRKLLDLYIYILPLKSFPGISKFSDIDLVIVRQNTEGEYLMLEHEPVPGSVESLKVLTRYNTTRLAEHAYQYAVSHKRKLMTVLHTSDVHPIVEGLFVEAVLKVSEKYPEIRTQVKDVRTACTDLLRKPQNFDMIIATNLNGSMISNFLNGVVGGPTLSAGMNLSEDGIAVFEPGVRNKGSGIVNKGIANPTAMVLAASNLLGHCGYQKTSHLIRNAAYKSAVVDRILSQELGGRATTKQITDNIIRHVKELLGPSQRVTRPSKVKHKRWKTPQCEKPRKESECGCDES